MNPTLFGTDGVRAAIGHEPFTAACLARLAHAIGTWSRTRYGNHPHIVIAHDSRSSADWIKATLTQTLLLHGACIHDAGVLPTPAVYQLLADSDEMHAGIMISASHNPYTDNGIKLIDRYHGKIIDEDEQLITQLYYSASQFNPNYTQLGTVTPWLKASFAYCNEVLKYVKPDFLVDRKIVLDCANGATHHVAPEIFRACGAHVVAINDRPNGKNINDNCGTVYPKQLQDAVIAHQADAGFAFDGDGDRVVAVNKHGECKDGDDLLALLLQHQQYQHMSTVVGTVMSNQGFATWLTYQHKTLLRTPVGDKHVAHALYQHNLLLGGETSGHIILRDYADTGDGIFAALRVTQAIQQTNNWDMVTFKKFPQVLVNLVVKEKKDLNEPTLATIIAAGNQQLPTGRVLIRYSGTEPVLRIMAEDADQQRAQAVATELSKKFAQQLT